MRASCKGCIHYRNINSGGTIGCHYLFDTNTPRGCTAEDCDKKASAGYIVKAGDYGRDKLVFVDNDSLDNWYR